MAYFSPTDQFSYISVVALGMAMTHDFGPG